MLQIDKLPDRGVLGSFLQQHRLDGAGVEIGVQRGYYSKHILNSWKSCTKYVLVDTWKKTANYTDNANVEDSQQEAILALAKKNTKGWEGKVQIMRNYSTVAALAFANNSVDFVYVDARHDYCGVKEDIEAWWPKVATRGFMAGHDYMTGYQHLKAKNVDYKTLYDPKDDWTLCYDGITVNEGAVRGAVEDFAKLHNLTVHKTMNDGPHFTWLVKIPLNIFSSRSIHRISSPFLPFIYPPPD